MTETLTVAILAAGASRRLGRPKQLVEINGEPLIRRQCRVALEADVGPVTVILGAHAEECATAIVDLLVAIRVNSDWEEGLASSIREASHAAIETHSAGLLILHGDQYRVTADDLRTIHSAWTDTQRSKGCRSVFEDCAGPPVILPASAFSEALKLRGENGARSVLAALGRENVIDVPMPNAGYDLDFPEQLAELRSKRG